MKKRFISMEWLLSNRSLYLKKCGIGEGTAMLIGGIASAVGSTAAGIATADTAAAVSEETMGWQEVENQRARDFAGMQQHYAQEFTKEQTQVQQNFARDILNQMNEYNSPVHQLSMYRDAGLNPNALQQSGNFQSASPILGAGGSSSAASPSIPNMSAIGQIAAGLKGDSYKHISQAMEKIGDAIQKIPQVKADVDLKKAQADKEKHEAKLQAALAKRADYEVTKLINADEYLSKQFTWYMNPNAPDDGSITNYYSPELAAYSGQKAPDWYTEGMSAIAPDKLPNVVAGKNMAAFLDGYIRSQDILDNLSSKRLGLSKKDYDFQVQQIDNEILRQVKDSKEFKSVRHFMMTKDYEEFRRGLMVARAQAYQAYAQGDLATAQKLTEPYKRDLLDAQKTTEGAKQDELGARQSYTETLEQMAPYELGLKALGGAGDLLLNYLTTKQNMRTAKLKTGPVRSKSGWRDKDGSFYEEYNY